MCTYHWNRLWSEGLQRETGPACRLKCFLQIRSNKEVLCLGWVLESKEKAFLCQPYGWPFSQMLKWTCTVCFVACRSSSTIFSIYGRLLSQTRRVALCCELFCAGFWQWSRVSESQRHRVSLKLRAVMSLQRALSLSPQFQLINLPLPTLHPGNIPHSSSLEKRDIFPFQDLPVFKMAIDLQIFSDRKSRSVIFFKNVFALDISLSYELLTGYLYFVDFNWLE